MLLTMWALTQVIIRSSKSDTKWCVERALLKELTLSSQREHFGMEHLLRSHCRWDSPRAFKDWQDLETTWNRSLSSPKQQKLSKHRAASLSSLLPTALYSVYFLNAENVFILPWCSLSAQQMGVGLNQLLAGAP